MQYYGITKKKVNENLCNTTQSPKILILFVFIERYPVEEEVHATRDVLTIFNYFFGERIMRHATSALMLFGIQYQFFEKLSE